MLLMHDLDNEVDRTRRRILAGTGCAAVSVAGLAGVSLSGMGLSGQGLSGVDTSGAGRGVPGSAHSEGRAKRAALINSLFGAAFDACAVGAAWLGQSPAEADPGFLWTSLFGAHEPADRESCARALAQAIEADFQRRELVSIRGWLLARAEARACALIYLS